jgi:hypothetical protein
MKAKHLILTAIAALLLLALSATAQTAGTVFAWGQNGYG